MKRSQSIKPYAWTDTPGLILGKRPILRARWRFAGGVLAETLDGELFSYDWTATAALKSSEFSALRAALP